MPDNLDFHLAVFYSDCNVPQSDNKYNLYLDVVQIFIIILDIS